MIVSGEVCDPGEDNECTKDCINIDPAYFCYVYSSDNSKCVKKNSDIQRASVTSSSFAGITTLIFILPAAITSSLGPSVWINMLVIQFMSTTTIFSPNQNYYAQNTFNNNYQAFRLNYDFTK